MYLAVSQQYQRQPFTIPKLNKKVYTFEGFCYYLLNHYDLMMELVNQKAYVNWIGDNLGLESIAKTLMDMKAGGSSSLKIIEWLLKQCPYTATKSIEPIRTYYQEIMDMPVHLQHKRVGNEQLELGHYKNAISWYKKAQKIQPSSEVENNMGIAYLMMHKYMKALKAFDKSIDLDDGIKKRLNRVKVFLMLEKFEEALEELNHIRGLDEGFDVWFGYGCAYEGLGRVEEALAAYQRAYQVDPSDKVIYKVVALCHSVDQEPLLELWIKREQLSNKMLYYMQAHLLLREDQVGYGLKMDKVLEEDGHDSLILMELSRFYSNRRQIIKALEYVRQMPYELSDSDEVLYQKSLIAKAAGNRESYESLLDELTDKWKNEVRKNTIG